MPFWLKLGPSGLRLEKNYRAFAPASQWRPLPQQACGGSAPLGGADQLAELELDSSCAAETRRFERVCAWRHWRLPNSPKSLPRPSLEVCLARLKVTFECRARLPPMHGASGPGGPASGFAGGWVDAGGGALEVLHARDWIRRPRWLPSTQTRTEWATIDRRISAIPSAAFFGTSPWRRWGPSSSSLKSFSHG